MLYKFTELTKEEYTEFEKQSSVGTFYNQVNKLNYYKNEAIKYGC